MSQAWLLPVEVRTFKQIMHILTAIILSVMKETSMALHMRHQGLGTLMPILMMTGTAVLILISVFISKSEESAFV